MNEIVTSLSMSLLIIKYFCSMSSQSYFQAQTRYKIILVGQCGAGKTSIFWRYIKNQQLSDQAFSAVDFRYKEIKLQDKKVKLCIWDTAGQEKYRSIVATYFKSCDGVVLVFDLSNKKSWEGIKNVWYQMAMKRTPNARYMLLGSKSDLQLGVDLAEINKWCSQRGVFFIQTSAKTGSHIEQAFFTLAALISCHKTDQAPVFSSFSSSFQSNVYRTETTKENDEGWKTQMRGYKLSSSKAASFCLKRESKVTHQNCCK